MDRVENEGEATADHVVDVEDRGELEKELRERGLPTDGRKPELQSRLLSDTLNKQKSDDASRKRKADEVVDALRKQVECPVCYESMESPIFQCIKGHVICHGCKDQLNLPKKCPTCRVVLRDDMRCLVLEQMADTMMTPCKHSGRGWLSV
jgi:E3 ubiquitin-protein ligase SIAH1